MLQCQEYTVPLTFPIKSRKNTVFPTFVLPLDLLDLQRLADSWQAELLVRGLISAMVTPMVLRPAFHSITAFSAVI